MSENDRDNVLMAGQHVRKPHATNEYEYAVLPAPSQREVVDDGKEHIADENSSIEVHSVR